MRFVMLGVLVGCFCLDPIGRVKAASWTSAKFAGEQSRAVQGCVDSPQKASKEDKVLHREVVWVILGQF